MRKTLTIGGEDVVFECTSVTPVFYKTEFRRDFFGDMIKLSKSMAGANLDNSSLESMSYEDIDHIDFDAFSRMAYACFKTADPKTKLGYVEWLTEHPDFSAIEHGMEISEIIISGMQPKKK